jgi:hypothetical protein
MPYHNCSNNRCRRSFYSFRSDAKFCSTACRTAQHRRDHLSSSNDRLQKLVTDLVFSPAPVEAQAVENV